jgi:hypothetical protein
LPHSKVSFSGRPAWRSMASTVSGPRPLTCRSPPVRSNGSAHVPRCGHQANPRAWARTCIAPAGSHAMPDKSIPTAIGARCSAEHTSESGSMAVNRKRRPATNTTLGLHAASSVVHIRVRAQADAWIGPGRWGGTNHTCTRLILLCLERQPVRPPLRQRDTDGGSHCRATTPLHRANGTDRSTVRPTVL